MKRTLLLKTAAVGIGVIISLVAAELILRVQNFVELENFSEKRPWNPVLHHGSDTFTITDYGADCSNAKIKLLLLGDSWMEDENLSSAIGQELAIQSGKCVQVYNGGTTSYAPTLYLLKARRAFKTYGKFDYIVVNIDETDIGDEWLRYRVPTIRDDTGKIVAVPFECDLHSEYIWNGKLWAEDSDFYIVRLARFTFFYKVLVPMFYKLTYRPDYQNLMKYVFGPDARTLFKKEHQYFSRILLRMATTITAFTSGAGHVYITHHPHHRGLIDSIDEGRLYLPIVSEQIEQVSKKIGVKALDARKYMEQIHGSALLKDTFEEGDPFSHLVSNGAKRYGKWIGSRIDLQ